jgi:hypothetical protein
MALGCGTAAVTFPSGSLTRRWRAMVRDNFGTSLKELLEFRRSEYRRVSQYVLVAIVAMTVTTILTIAADHQHQVPTPMRVIALAIAAVAVLLALGGLRKASRLTALIDADPSRPRSTRKLGRHQRDAIVRFLLFEAGVALLPVLWSAFGDYVLATAHPAPPGEVARHGDLYLLSGIVAFLGLATFVEKSKGAMAGRHASLHPSTALASNAARLLVAFGAILCGASGVDLYERAARATLASGTSPVWHAWLVWLFSVIAGSACVVAAEN